MESLLQQQYNYGLKTGSTWKYILTQSACFNDKSVTE